jgi:GT2 family glycosyltransferase
MVTWNSAATLIACLDAVWRQTLANFEIIVVDNHSTDETLSILERYPIQKLLKQPGNLGFSRGHNLAIAQARGQYVLPLNPDVVMHDTYLENLVRAAETYPQVGMVAGKLVLSPAASPDAAASPDSATGLPRLDSTGLFLAKTRRQYLRGHYEPDTARYDQADFVFGADGAAPLYRKTMLDACNFQGEYFDEAFFAYKEDVDLAWRAQLLGWPARYCPQAVAVHHRTFKPGRRRGLSPAIRRHSVKNRYLLLIKNELPQTFFRHSPHILFYDLKIMIYLLLFEQSSLLSLLSLVVLLPRAWRWRRFIMARRKVDAAYMLKWMK